MRKKRQEKESWYDQFDERQKKLINNCRRYAESEPAGLPGHNLMLIIAGMSKLLDEREEDG
jgi:hypothetical protein